MSNVAIHDVIWLIRLPRIILALCIGLALSVCGVVMQSIVKNPLADPYILGVSSEASLGDIISIMLGFTTLLGSNSIGIFAFLGAFSSFFIFTLILLETIYFLSQYRILNLMLQEMMWI